MRNIFEIYPGDTAICLGVQQHIADVCGEILHTNQIRKVLESKDFTFLLESVRGAA